MDQCGDSFTVAYRDMYKQNMAKGDEREVGFRNGGCFLKFLKREQINNQTFIAFLNWD